MNRRYFLSDRLSAPAGGTAHNNTANRSSEPSDSGTYDRFAPLQIVQFGVRVGG
jgi:hypothetical protein